MNTLSLRIFLLILFWAYLFCLTGCYQILSLRIVFHPWPHPFWTEVSFLTVSFFLMSTFGSVYFSQFLLSSTCVIILSAQNFQTDHTPESKLIFLSFYSRFFSSVLRNVSFPIMNITTPLWGKCPELPFPQFYYQLFRVSFQRFQTIVYLLL